MTLHQVGFAPQQKIQRPRKGGSPVQPSAKGGSPVQPQRSAKGGPVTQPGFGQRRNQVPAKGGPGPQPGLKGGAPQQPKPFRGIPSRRVF